MSTHEEDEEEKQVEEVRKEVEEEEEEHSRVLRSCAWRAGRGNPPRRPEGSHSRLKSPTQTTCLGRSQQSGDYIGDMTPLNPFWSGLVGVLGVLCLAAVERRDRVIWSDFYQTLKPGSQLANEIVKET